MARLRRRRAAKTEPDRIAPVFPGASGPAALRIGMVKYGSGTPALPPFGGTPSARSPAVSGGHCVGLVPWNASPPETRQMWEGMEYLPGRKRSRGPSEPRYPQGTGNTIATGPADGPCAVGKADIGSGTDGKRARERRRTTPPDLEFDGQGPDVALRGGSGTINGR